MKSLALWFFIAVLIPCGVLAWLAQRAMQEEQAAFLRQHVELAQGKVVTLAAQCRELLQEQLRDFERTTDAMLVADQKQASLGRKSGVGWERAEQEYAWMATEPPARSAGDSLARSVTDMALGLRKEELSAVKSALPKLLEIELSDSKADHGLAKPSSTLADNAPLASALVPLPAKDKETTFARSKGSASPNPLVTTTAAPMAEDRLAVSDNRGLDRKDSDIECSAYFKKEPDALGPNLESLQETQPESFGIDFGEPLGTASDQPATVTVRTVTPQHLSAADQQALGHFSLLAAPQPALTELVRAEKSGIIGRLEGAQGFQLVAWYRSPNRPETIWGARLSIPKVLAALQALTADSTRQAEADNLYLTVLDQRGLPVLKSAAEFTTEWSHPYVSLEISPNLPHWEAAAYLMKPDAVQLSARAAQWKLGLIVLAVMVAALGGAALFWLETKRRWQEAQQKTDFVSQVSHELRTPLTAIQMFSDLLAQPNADSEKIQRYAGVISQEAHRLTRLINTVLDFSKLDRHGVSLQRTPCDLRPLVEQTLERYRPHLESLGFQVTLALPAEPISLPLDADRIAQIFLNLLSNAEKYALQGGVIDIALTADSLDSKANLTVADRGPGIPPGQEKRIFKKFFRVHNSLDSGIHGTGLGLTLARNLARAHGGDITYACREGGGSVFQLTLPMT